MNNLRSISRPTAVSSFVCRGRGQVRHLGFSSAPRIPILHSPFPSSSTDDLPRSSLPSSRTGHRRTLTRVSNWNSEKSPYETLELDRDADDEKIKIAYRRLAKFYHPDVYDGRGTLEEGETAEARFIKIQAAYELLIDEEQRGQYDRDHRVNPMKASQAWMEWLMKKRKAFDQRGDVAIVAWAEQQQRELNIRARRLSRSKSAISVLRRCKESVTFSLVKKMQWAVSMTLPVNNVNQYQCAGAVPSLSFLTRSFLLRLFGLRNWNRT